MAKETQPTTLKRMRKKSITPPKQGDVPKLETYFRPFNVTIRN